jgi:prepilin-type N-terminal cleavage/methylation domain-containing protein
MRRREMNSAFTMAEVLITLMIVGIISSIVIPEIISDTQNQQYKIAYKKAFATISQAWQSAYSENLLLPRIDQYSNYNYVKNFNVFKSKMIVTKDCNNNNNNECWADGEKLHDSTPTMPTPAFIDNSGMSWSLIYPNAGNLGDKLLVDTNGFKKPNKFGKDRFILVFCDGQNNFTSSGIPIKPCPMSEWATNGDFINPDSYWCPSGKCFNRSWLIN